jgi:hypothetical protein
MITGETKTTLTHRAVSNGLQAAGVNEKSAERSASIAEFGLGMVGGVNSIRTVANTGPSKLVRPTSTKPANATNGGGGGVKNGGRLGNSATRNQNAEIATELESRGYTIINGGGMRNGIRLPEEYLKPLGGGRSGGSYLDLTATHPKYGTLRINTVSTLKDGKTPTLLEWNNATRIRTQIAPGEHLLLIPKK